MEVPAPTFSPSTGSTGPVVRDMIRRGEHFYPDKKAVVCGDENWTYRQFGTRVRKLAGALTALGVSKGDRVAVLMFNCHRYLELFAACFELGAIIVPLNIRLAAPELIYTINDAGAQLLVLDENSLPLLESIRPSLLNASTTYIAAIAATSEEGVRNLPAGVVSHEHLLQQTQELRQFPAIREEDVAAFFYTSGTTGNAKGVMLTNRNICANSLQGFTHRIPPPDTVHLHASPMFHIAGGPMAWLVFWVGGTHVIQPRFEPRSTFELLQRERVTRVLWVPTMIIALLAHPDVGRVDFSSLRLVLYGASPIAPERLKEARRVFGCELMQLYGMTEAAPTLTSLAPEEHIFEGDEHATRRLLSCGRAVLGVDIRVVDAQGEDVAPGEVGEIIARGANFMVGYWRKPTETAAALRDGWYYSGDMGVMDEEGYLYLKDRKKDMIISGGENVYSVEVENALSSHPAVLECAVIGSPDERWGEAVKAIVVLRPGMPASAEALIDHCHTRIAGYKCPRSVEFLDALPKNAAGKLLKRELRDTYWRGYNRRVN
ncbi:MAG: long-chain fatty acid--CoA ligase [Ktedonobacteraceae bacterium]